MIEMQKSQWEADAHNVHLSMPLTKIDQENRLVSGWATLDNTDTQGDVVMAEASVAAFAKFRGNIREMHDKIAAGRLVDFKEDEFYDADSQKFYKGIYVTAYISKGAQNTWEKVLDGTLTGFSIGGKIIDAVTEWVKDAGRSVRFVKAFDLFELSLVDNPANQLSNVDGITKVFSIESSDDGMVMKGMVAEVEVNNIFWCDEHRVAKTSDGDTAVCSACDAEMELIGWYESGDDAAEKVSEAIDKYLNPETDEGGVEVSKEEETTTEEETVAPDEAVLEETEETEAAPVDEVSNDEPDFEKLIDEINTTVTKALEETKEVTSTVVKSVEEKIEKALEFTKNSATELKDQIEALENRVNEIKKGQDKVSKAVEALQKGTASKQSVDVEDEESTDTTESFWKGMLSLDRL